MRTEKNILHKMIETILKNFHIEMETIKDKIEAIDVRTVDGILAGLIKLRKISVHQRLFKSAATLVPTIWSSDGPQRTFMGTGHSPYATNYAPRHATNPPIER